MCSEQMEVFSLGCLWLLLESSAVLRGHSASQCNRGEMFSENATNIFHCTVFRRNFPGKQTELLSFNRKYGPESCSEKPIWIELCFEGLMICFSVGCLGFLETFSLWFGRGTGLHFSFFFYILLTDYVYVRQWWRDTVVETDDSTYKDVYLGRTGSIFDYLLPPSPFSPVYLWSLSFGDSGCFAMNILRQIIFTLWYTQNYFGTTGYPLRYFPFKRGSKWF